MYFKFLLPALVVVLWSAPSALATYSAMLDRFLHYSDIGEEAKDPLSMSYIDSLRSSIRRNWENSPSGSEGLDLNYRGLLNDAAKQRDEEYIPENPLWGYQFISGGSGEQHLTPQGKQKTTKQEIKSDRDLPAYCNPPNPCPKGYTERSGCLEKFENTADSNREYQESQNCPCDADHMFSCPAGSKVINTKSRKATASIGSGVAHALGNQESNEKRQSVVAKKSPLPSDGFQSNFLDLSRDAKEMSLDRIAKKAPYI
ncbi:uncharacterized protein LOC115222598 [Argonauta hians]